MDTKKQETLDLFNNPAGSTGSPTGALPEPAEASSRFACGILPDASFRQTAKSDKPGGYIRSFARDAQQKKSRERTARIRRVMVFCPEKRHSPMPLCLTDAFFF
jgi:hypothetical protein